jgi:ABC-type tungstate transport system substrate-binding protein
MDKWEYKTIYTTTTWGGALNISEYEKELNRLGEAGWELISFVITGFSEEVAKQGVSVLKRRK